MAWIWTGTSVLLSHMWKTRQEPLPEFPLFRCGSQINLLSATQQVKLEDGRIVHGLVLSSVILGAEQQWQLMEIPAGFSLYKCLGTRCSWVLESKQKSVDASCLTAFRCLSESEIAQFRMDSAMELEEMFGTSVPFHRTATAAFGFPTKGRFRCLKNHKADRLMYKLYSWTLAVFQRALLPATMTNNSIDVNQVVLLREFWWAALCFTDDQSLHDYIARRYISHADVLSVMIAAGMARLQAYHVRMSQNNAYSYTADDVEPGSFGSKERTRESLMNQLASGNFFTSLPEVWLKDVEELFVQ